MNKNHINNKIDNPSNVDNKKQNKSNDGVGNKKNSKNKKNNNKSLTIFGIAVVIYIILYFIYPDRIMNSLEYVLKILKEILPILLFVYVFMLIFSLFNEDKIKSSIEKAPAAIKYILMSALGTLSHGPIYAWYPFLKNLNEKGLSKGTMGTFLYARGIKLTLLPMLASFFGLKYVIILTITTLLFSIIEGVVIDLTDKI